MSNKTIAKIKKGEIPTIEELTDLVDTLERVRRSRWAISAQLAQAFAKPIRSRLSNKPLYVKPDAFVLESADRVFGLDQDLVRSDEDGLLTIQGMEKVPPKRFIQMVGSAVTHLYRLKR